MFFFLLVIAGNDTVRSALPGGVLALAATPRPATVAARDAGTPAESAIEEMLRWHPPVLTFRRTATRDTELAGGQIGRGDKVVVYHISANSTNASSPTRPLRHPPRSPTTTWPSARAHTCALARTSPDCSCRIFSAS